MNYTIDVDIEFQDRTLLCLYRGILVTRNVNLERDISMNHKWAILLKKNFKTLFADDTASWKILTELRNFVIK